MYHSLLKKFGFAAVAIAVAFVCVYGFMRYSAPKQEPVQAHNHATSGDHKQCAVNIAGKQLPSLTLRDTDGRVVQAAQMSTVQPVILIRYLGYGCSHCIEQLLALQKNTDKLKALNAKVIAFSEDGADENKAVVKKYGFDENVFTFASDAANMSADQIGALYKEKDGTTTELHVAMVLENGRVIFANMDTKPFMDVQVLLTQASLRQNEQAAQQKAQRPSL